MKRTLKYALSAVITAALVVPALAQDNFPDTPENHWAYEALANMKREGLLVGYPDGLFRGGRPASRYELAVAIHATYQHLKGITDNLQRQIDAMGKGGPGFDPTDIRNAITALQNDVNAMKGWGDDIAALKRMAATFEKELASLGVDVEAMKKDLADLSDRVSALEKRKLPVDIHGDVNFVGIGGYSDDDEFGITVDGRPTGFGRGLGYAGLPVGATRDLTILHEGAISLTGTNDTGPKWNATFVMGNMLGDGAFFQQSRPVPAGFSPTGVRGFGGPNNFIESDNSIYIQNFEAGWDTSMLGLAFNLRVGRSGYSVSPMMFQRPDNSPYYANDRWDNGKWAIDGANFGFNFGSAKLNVFGGRMNTQVDDNGFLMQPIYAGRSTSPFAAAFAGGDRPRGNEIDLLTVDQMLGVHANIPIASTGTLNLAYLWLGSNNGTNLGGIGSEPINGVNVYGGDVRFNLGSLAIDAGWSKSDVVYNSDAKIDEDNTAWFAQLAFNQDKFGIKAGYRSIDPLYGAPGDWGRIGIWWNPTDIEGWNINAHFDLSESLRLMGSFENYDGQGSVAGGLGEDDNVNRWTLGLGYKMASGYDLTLGYEEVRWDLTSDFGGGQPHERWINIGFGFDLSGNAKLKFLWQISDYDNDGNGSWNPFEGFGAATAKGGVITSQLSIKY